MRYSKQAHRRSRRASRRAFRKAEISVYVNLFHASVQQGLRNLLLGTSCSWPDSGYVPAALHAFRRHK